MIKRDFTEWDFVKQEPKTQHNNLVDITDGTYMFTDGNIYNTTMTWSNNITVTGINNVAIGCNAGTNLTTEENVVTIGNYEGNDTFTVHDGVVTVNGELNTTPTQGQMFFDTTDNTMKVYVNGEWVVLGDYGADSGIITETPRRTFEGDIRKLSSLWTKIKNLFKFKA
jgi:hypothetical protein